MATTVRVRVHSGRADCHVDAEVRDGDTVGAFQQRLLAQVGWTTGVDPGLIMQATWLQDSRGRHLLARAALPDACALHGLTLAWLPDAVVVMFIAMDSGRRLTRVLFRWDQVKDAQRRLAHALGVAPEALDVLERPGSRELHPAVQLGTMCERRDPGLRAVLWYRECCSCLQDESDD